MAAGLLHFSNHEIVLFNFWKVGSTLGMIGSVFMVLLIGVLHEAIIGLRYFLDREIMLGDSRHSSEHLVVDHGIESTSKARRVNSTTSSTTSGGSGSVLLRHLRRIFSKQRMLQACLYAVQWTLFFTLILFVMTLNVWLVLAAILGKSIGYLVFIGSPALEKVERIAVYSVGSHGLRLSDARNNLRSF